MTVAVLLFIGVNCYGGDNEIYGCYQKNGGDLRIVKHPKSCRHSEIPISWNKVGPQGPVGPAGPQGPQAPLNQSEEFPKVYDAQNQFLGIFPSSDDGFLSFFVPGLSKFVSLSTLNGDLDPSVQVFYDGLGCSGSSYVYADMRYQIMKLKSEYLMADDVKADCITIRSVSKMKWSELRPGEMYRECEPAGAQCNLLPSSEVSLPFSLPAGLPVQFK